MNSDEHNPMENWPGEDISDSQTYDANVRLTLLAIVTLSTLGIIMAFSYLYDRYSRSRHHARHNHQRRRTMFLFAADPSPPASVTPSTGLDPAVLKSLPVFAFSAAKDPIECAVCLSEFEEGETGRVLPGCKHAFHVECIDMWFHSHSTCPLCRSLVELPPAATMTTVEEKGVTVIMISREPVSGRI
ncbi:RING-H2 finger protein ATL2-like [Raphanus sativus]|uniref:RING-type E3 ubiquitin transferase n=1 Tax=Raphanus sativus TaxID=3726 RepID=A0A9W3C1R3_RAPSA|nr:RING-H2 finger protein ATL2-like [Raphanus sativus]